MTSNWNLAGSGRRSFGVGAVIIGDVHGERRPPRPGEVSQSVMVRVEDLDAHWKRARAHGARIVEEPTDFPFGERQYAADDPAGHRWTFSETLADVDPLEWGGTPIASDRSPYRETAHEPGSIKAHRRDSDFSTILRFGERGSALQRAAAGFLECWSP